MISCLDDLIHCGAIKATDDPATVAIIAWRDHGDETAAGWIVQQLTPLMQGIALRSLPRAWMAEDAVQMTLVKVFRSLDTFDPRVPLSAWAVLIMKNVCSNILRGWRKRSVFSAAEMDCDQLQDLERGAGRPSLDDTLMARDELRAVMRRIGSMGEIDRHLISLLFMAGSSAEDAGRQTGLSAGAVRVRASRIRTALRADLQERHVCISNSVTRSPLHAL